MIIIITLTNTPCHRYGHKKARDHNIAFLNITVKRFVIVIHVLCCHWPLQTTKEMSVRSLVQLLWCDLTTIGLPAKRKKGELKSKLCSFSRLHTSEKKKRM